MADTDKLVKVGQLDSVADAVIEVISETNERLDNVKADVSNATGNSSVSSWNTGYYALNSSATSVDPSVISTNKYYRCVYLDCSEGDVFYYTGHGTASARSWALLDANNNIISRASAGDFTDEKITIPQGIDHIVFNVGTGDGLDPYYVFVGEPLADQVDENRNSIAENKVSIDRLKKSLSSLYSAKSVNAVGEYIGEFAAVEDVSVTGATSLTVATAQMFEAVFNGLSSYGVTVVKNADGTYTIDGTATSGVWMYLNQSTRLGEDNLLALDGTYTVGYEIVAGTYRPVTYTGSTFGIVGLVEPGGTQQLIRTLDNDGETKESNTGIVSGDFVVACKLTTGVQYDNMRIAITLNKGDMPYPYVPYVEPTTVTDFTDIKNIVSSYTPYIWLTASPSTANIDITGKVIDIESGGDEPTVELPDILTKYNDRVDLLAQLFTRPLFLVYADIHNNANNLARIKDWYSANKPVYVKDIYCLGDMVTDQATDTLAFADDSFWKATLKVIGNHDVLTNSTIPGITSIETYNKYLSADIGNWGVTQPTGAAANGLNYFYKDYSNKIRVIVLDTYFYTTEQHTWFVDTLESARTNGLAVIVAQHEDICTGSEKQPLNSEYPFGSKHNGFTGLQYRTYGNGGNYQTKRNAVDDFIGNGGSFVCWLSGHMHTDMAGYYEGTNGKQLSIVLANASNSMTSSIRVNDYCQDSFNYIAVDTDEGCIYILRIGLDVDKWYHKNRFMRYDYVNHVVEEYN